MSQCVKAAVGALSRSQEAVRFFHTWSWNDCAKGLLWIQIAHLLFSKPNFLMYCNITSSLQQVLILSNTNTQLEPLCILLAYHVRTEIICSCGSYNDYFASKMMELEQCFDNLAGAGAALKFHLLQRPGMNESTRCS